MMKSPAEVPSVPIAAPKRVRFATPELEASEAAFLVQRAAEKREHRLVVALRSNHFNHGGDCLPCVARFILNGGAAAAIAEIDAALAAEELERAATFRIEIGQWWRLLIGPALAAKITAVLSVPDDLCRKFDLPALEAVAPELDMMVIGGEGHAYAPTAVLLVPIDMQRIRSAARPTVRVTPDYLLEHGVRCS